MRKHIPHPVTRLSSPCPTLDILYGGNEADAIEESLTIARDLREVLRDGENILYVNTLVSESHLSQIMGKRFDHGARRGRNHFVTYCFGEIIDKLQVIRNITEERSIRYLVVTGFELATLGSRHRAVFMSWLRMMRNIGVNVIIFTMTQPGRYGSLGGLRYSARSAAEVGEYLKHANVAEGEGAAGAAAVSKEFAALMESELIGAKATPAKSAATPSEEVFTEVSAGEGQEEEEEEVESVEGVGVESDEEVEDELEFSDEPDATLLYSKLSRPQHSDSVSLKTKDLAVELV